MKPTIESTRALIHQLHEGQTDHSGKPYIYHPLRVAQNVRTISIHKSAMM